MSHFYSSGSNVICRFSTKESAAHAIVAVHNSEVNGQVVKCSWGKENSDLTTIQPGAQFEQSIANASFPYTYGQQMGYWYPQSFPAATAAATPQIPGQYLQCGFSLGQFGYHQDFLGWEALLWNYKMNVLFRLPKLNCF